MPQKTQTDAMTDILHGYDLITLEEMKRVKLMNRIDTKYLTTRRVMLRFLEHAKSDYRLQHIGGEYLLPYYTLYFDTEGCSMYMAHLLGRKNRQKIRIRKYETSGTSFLEVKNKNNKGRTKKKRISCEDYNTDESQDFLEKHSKYPCPALCEQIENKFSRITLVNRNLTERLTIDMDLRFHNCRTGKACGLDDLVIIELKRDGHTMSASSRMLHNLHIQPARFSKYCMGMALTNETLKRNRFKPRLRLIDKMCNIERDINF